MKALIVLLLWLLLGFGYYSAQNAYCNSSQSTAALPQAKVMTKAINPALQSQTITQEASDVDTTITQTIDYAHSTFVTFEKDGNKTVIDITEDEPMNDEMNALLESSCNELQNNMKKILITSYGNTPDVTMKKMEDALIRCGLSPQRVLLYSKKSNDTYDNKLVFEIIE